LLLHHSTGVLNAQKIAGQIDRQNPVPLFQRRIEDAALDGVRYVVDQNIQTSMFRL
jgi:hypothetical protein